MKNLIKKYATRENLKKLAVSVIISALIMVILPELPFDIKFFLKQTIKATMNH